ncbi:hypothetical protein LINPERHAP2_LOCUS7285 [Linum perenne]
MRRMMVILKMKLRIPTLICERVDQWWRWWIH